VRRHDRLRALIEPASKLATARLLDEGDGDLLARPSARARGGLNEQQLYGALDWLVEQTGAHREGAGPGAT